MATIREQVIEWLIDRGPGQFTVTSLGEELELTRRQVLNALHGLANSGLSDQLTRGVSGMWEYHPPEILRRQESVPVLALPMGFVDTFKVLGRAGERYLIKSDHGGFAWLEIIVGPMERLVEHDPAITLVPEDQATAAAPNQEI